MKILKPGKLPGEKIHRGRCITCGCEFEFKQNEAKMWYDRNESGLRIKCPMKDCKADVWVAL